jgi:hypothetical protein
MMSKPLFSVHNSVENMERILGFELRARCLLGSCFTAWVMPPDIFFSYFLENVLLLPWAGLKLWSAYLCLHTAGIPEMQHNA